MILDFEFVSNPLAHHRVDVVAIGQTSAAPSTEGGTRGLAHAASEPLLAQTKTTGAATAVDLEHGGGGSGATAPPALLAASSQGLYHATIYWGFDEEPSSVEDTLAALGELAALCPALSLLAAIGSDAAAPTAEAAQPLGGRSVITPSPAPGTARVTFYTSRDRLLVEAGGAKTGGRVQCLRETVAWALVAAQAEMFNALVMATAGRAVHLHLPMSRTIEICTFIDVRKVLAADGSDLDLDGCGAAGFVQQPAA